MGLRSRTMFRPSTRKSPDRLRSARAPAAGRQAGRQEMETEHVIMSRMLLLLLVLVPPLWLM